MAIDGPFSPIVKPFALVYAFFTLASNDAASQSGMRDLIPEAMGATLHARAVGGVSRATGMVSGACQRSRHTKRVGGDWFCQRENCSVLTLRNYEASKQGGPGMWNRRACKRGVLQWRGRARQGRKMCMVRVGERASSQ